MYKGDNTPISSGCCFLMPANLHVP